MKRSSHRRVRPGHPFAPADPVCEPGLEQRLQLLVDGIFADLATCARRPDPLFRRHAEGIALSHHAYGHEARLIEQATAMLCAEQPHLQVVALARPLPIVASALDALRGNDWTELEGIRLPSRVFAEASYMPDLVVLDRRNRALFVFDIKRSVDNKASKMGALKKRLQAVALVAPDWLAAEAHVHAIETTRVAILDASGEVSDPEAGILPLASLGSMLDVPDFAARIADLRTRLAVLVEAEMDRLQPDRRERPGPDRAHRGIRRDEAEDEELPAAPVDRAAAADDWDALEPDWLAAIEPHAEADEDAAPDDARTCAGAEDGEPPAGGGSRPSRGRAASARPRFGFAMPAVRDAGARGAWLAPDGEGR